MRDLPSMLYAAPTLTLATGRAPIALLNAGLMALAFLGLSGLGAG